LRSRGICAQQLDVRSLHALARCYDRELTKVTKSVPAPSEVTKVTKSVPDLTG
jgi:hypothetical protein